VARTPGTGPVQTNLILPVIGICANCSVLYENFLETFVFRPASFATQTSVTVACFTPLALAITATIIGPRRNGGVPGAPHLLDDASARPDP
jgi:hypothetical protein